MGLAAEHTPAMATGRHMWARATTPEDKAWLVERVGCILTDKAKGVAVVDGHGTTVAAFVCDRWTETLAEAHIAVDSPIALRTLTREGFRWFFQHREILVGHVRASNTRALKLDAHLGFREVARIRDGFARGDDLVILELRRENCRWLKEGLHG